MAAHTLVAAMFLSRLPLNGLAMRLADDEEVAGFSETTRYFGLAAIIVALPSAFVLWVAGLTGLPISVQAILAVVALVLTTGALHEDALADVADGFGGGKTVEDKLLIMRDSQIGSYGASALILSFALQLILLVELLARVPTDFAPLVIIMVNVTSTTMIIGPWVALEPARSDGLSTGHGMPTMDTLITATLIGIPIVIVMGWISLGLISTVFGLLICFATCAAFSLFCDRQIGGHTGDTLGATKKICELGLLLALVMAT